LISPSVVDRSERPALDRFMGRAVKGASVNQVYTRQSITAVDDSDLDNRWSPKTGAVSVFRASTYNWATRGRLSAVQTVSVGEFVR
ncbi:hypothetical protein J6590_107715, partial [Homalodisca vitripennis]